MQFRCSIPTSKRAFDVPGTRADLRVSFDVPESEMIQSIRLIVFRGLLFHLKIYEVIENPEGDPPETFELKGETLAMISPKANALRIDGEAGMSLTLSFPSISTDLFSLFLKLREKSLILDIDEETYRKVG